MTTTVDRRSSNGAPWPQALKLRVVRRQLPWLNRTWELMEDSQPYLIKPQDFVFPH